MTDTVASPTADRAPQDPRTAGGRADDSPRPRPTGLFPGDTGALGRDTRHALVRLVRGPFLDGHAEPQAWAALRRDDALVRRALSELFLTLVVDEDERVAFTRQAEDPETGASVPRLLRRWPLTLIDSALLLFLRQELSAVSGTGQRAVVGVEEIVDHLETYQEDDTTDHALRLKRIHASITKMRDNGVLRPTATDGRYAVSPVLRSLLPPEQIAALAEAYGRLARGEDPEADAVPDAPDDESTDRASDGPDEAGTATGDEAVDDVAGSNDDVASGDRMSGAHAPSAGDAGEDEEHELDD